MRPNKSELPAKRKSQTLRLLILVLGLGVACGLGAVEKKSVIFFGDSITAGSGLDPDEAYPALIGKKIEEAGLSARVVNAGLSGETTAGGLRRVDWVLRQPVDIFVIELGANDGLRGIPPETSRSNLQAIIDRVREKHPGVQIVLAGMQLPTNMGAGFTGKFAGIFPRLAADNRIALIPFLLEGVGGVASLNLADGIHPNAEGHRIVAETVWTTLRPLL